MDPEQQAKMDKRKQNFLNLFRKTTPDSQFDSLETLDIKIGKRTEQVAADCPILEELDDDLVETMSVS